jgi:hypothetical protein
MFREGLAWQLNLTDAPASDAADADGKCNTYSLFEKKWYMMYNTTRYTHGNIIYYTHVLHI